MELLKLGVRRSKIGEIAYIIINALLPIVLVLLVRNFDSPYLAIVIILLGKWRVFALRPRFWLVNIRANVIDLLVGLSIVVLIYLSMGVPVAQYALAIIYGVWLLYLKPRSNMHSILLQAGIAQFLALTVLFSLSVIINEPLLVIGCWVTGYFSARHVMNVHEEEYIDFISAAWGLFMAELGWLLYHWTLVYDIGLPIKLPQISLLSLVISFVAVRLYKASKENRLHDRALRVTTISSIILVVAILVFTRWTVII
ncbi:MAG TPA: hypothetical protein VNX65_00950 [Patescibacteria group bacterium]|jgi:hypothetical protein|nr:hypothetical protein [Patescibacteria group bacterium]